MTRPMICVAVAFIMTVVPVGLSAQHETAVTDTALKLIGNWTRDTSVPRGNCGGYKDERGNPIQDCSTPIDKLPMNDRARAWLKYYDELQSPTLNECAAITVPNLLGDVRPFSISFKTDSVIFNYEQMNIIRPVWMDGRKHPPATDLFQQGHAIGHWDGEDLVVESTNFTWDPEGIDDHLHFPSSTRKKITERYKLSESGFDDNHHHDRRSGVSHKAVHLCSPVEEIEQAAGRVVGCDPEITRTEMQLTAPVKYPGSVTP